MKKEEQEQREKYITTHKAARLLYVTPTTIIAWIKSGHIKCIKTLGKHRRISTSEIVKIRKIMEDPVFEIEKSEKKGEIITPT